MSSRLLILGVIVFVLLNVTLFLVSDRKNSSSSPFTNISEPEIKLLNYPVDPSHKGVKSTNLVYQFTGRVVKIEPVSENTRITLDISDSETPEFLATPETLVFKEYDPNPDSGKTTIRDVKVGSKVELSTNYDINSKKWNLVGISLLLDTP